MVGIEAQFASLPCLFSERVPKEVKFSDACRFRNLSDPLSDWVEDVLTLVAETNRNKMVECSIFDIKTAAVTLQTFYEKLVTD